MKIIVFGNIGSGKSTILNSLNDEFSFEKIAIDDFRRKFGDGSMYRELIARQNFFAAIKQNVDQFIECVGTGKVAEELFLLLQTFTEPIICIILLTPIEICKLRLTERIWDIPFPEPIDNVSSLIERVEVKIVNKEIQRQWSACQNIILLEKENNEIQDIQIIVSELREKIKSQNNINIIKPN